MSFPYIDKPQYEKDVRNIYKRLDSVVGGPTITGVPQYAIILWNQSNTCPSGFSRVTTVDGKFPRSASTVGGTGGNQTHQHQVALAAFYAPPAGGWGPPAAGTYTTTSADHTPLYFDVLFCKKT